MAGRTGEVSLDTFYPIDKHADQTAKASPAHTALCSQGRQDLPLAQGCRLGHKFGKGER